MQDAAGAMALLRITYLLTFCSAVWAAAFQAGGVGNQKDSSGAAIPKEHFGGRFESLSSSLFERKKLFFRFSFQTPTYLYSCYFRVAISSKKASADIAKETQYAPTGSIGNKTICMINNTANRLWQTVRTAANSSGEKWICSLLIGATFKTAIAEPIARQMETIGVRQLLK